MNKYCWLLFTILLSGNALANSEISTRVIGGDNAERNYPWFAAIYADGNLICGGALISSKWVITAAHCVYGSTKNFHVIIGHSTRYSDLASAISTFTKIYATNTPIAHENYNSTIIDNDIALIELSEDYHEAGFAIADSARFAQLEAGDSLSVVGFGYISNDYAVSPVLQEAQLPFIPANECVWTITDNMFCAGYQAGGLAIDTCFGDSGGPIYRIIDGELTLVGLVSYGDETCAEMEAVYTKVSNYKQWISDKINGYQVVEEGAALYKDNVFSPGLISVINYGTNTVNIGELTFLDTTYNEIITLNRDNCSDTLTASNPDNELDTCKIAFTVNNGVAADDYHLFKANLQVKEAGENEYHDYAIRFIVSEAPSPIITTTKVEVKSSSSGGSLGFFTLLFLIPVLISKAKSNNSLKNE